MNSHQIYHAVTNTIVELLEEHRKSWDKPWIALGQDNDYARNPTTGQYYRGINQFLLSCKLMKKGHLKNVWLTFNQAKKSGGSIRKGEKSTPVIFYKTAHIDKNGRYYSEETMKNISAGQIVKLGIEKTPILKLYRVFNLAQTVDLNPDWYECLPQEPLQNFIKDEKAEDLIYATGASIKISETNKAYYDSKGDYIQLPLREQFRGKTEPFYSVALHELGHWTGHSSRLNREAGKEFGDPEYAKEELIAELTSAYCCAHLGFSKTINSNAAYLSHWLSILKQDHKAIIRAAAAAQKAADLILEYSSLKVVGHG